MYRNYRHRNCCLNNNDYSNNDMIENICDNIDYNCCYNNQYDNCDCGFDEEDDVFPNNPMFGQSYVPWQVMDKTFIPKVGLKMGTIFPELVSPYMPGQSMEEIKYIENANTIKGGCNR